MYGMVILLGFLLAQIFKNFIVILIFMLLTSPCKIAKPYKNAFLKKSNPSVRKKEKKPHLFKFSFGLVPPCLVYLWLRAWQILGNYPCFSVWVVGLGGERMGDLRNWN